MRAVAALVLTAAIATSAGASASGTAVLGIDYRAKQLGWFDSATLAPLPGRKVPMPRTACSWSFSPDRALLAYTDCEGTLTFVNARTMRVAGKVLLAGWEGVTWLSRDRVVTTDNYKLVVIDVARKRVLRRIELPGRPWNRTVLPDARVVYAVTPPEEFGPARVVVLDADANVRIATLDRITVGAVFDTESGDPTGMVRTPGFAVDRDGGRAFVVSPELLVGEVDLSTLQVRYHGTSRSLAKTVSGPSRVAYWLGDGLLAVSGADYAIADKQTTITPFGLHVIDTRTWTIRTIDREASWAQYAAGVLLVTYDRGGGNREAIAWAPDGTVRYRLALGDQSWPNIYGSLAYICDHGQAVRMLNPATGVTTATLKNRSCVSLLDGGSSSS
ncbi:MAG TPA: hypothetical protein VGJ77_05520 [Gaiellaceae bacterium]